MTTLEGIKTLIRIANDTSLPPETRKLAKECVDKILDTILYLKEVKK